MGFKHQKHFLISLCHSLTFRYLIIVKCSEGSELQNGVDVPSKGLADEDWLFLL